MYCDVCKVVRSVCLSVYFFVRVCMYCVHACIYICIVCIGVCMGICCMYLCNVCIDVMSSHAMNLLYHDVM